MQASAFDEYRQLLYPIALNMLKNPMDAEDLVQETLLSWLSSARSEVANEKGYMVRSLINKCLNFLRKRKYEEGEISKDLLMDFQPASIDQQDRISLILLLLMEILSPLERAVYLLKEIFGYSHKEIAELLGISEVYSRQLLARAKKYLHAQHPRFDVDSLQHEHLFQTFIKVCEGEDIGQLIEILKEDVALYINGAKHAIEGRAKVATTLWSMKSVFQGAKVHKENYPKLVWDTNKKVERIEWEGILEKRVG